MLAAAVHELRGPLGVARGYLRLLEKRGNDDARAQKAVEEAGHAAERMTLLLLQLSDYTRLASGESRLHTELTPLRDVLEAAAGRVPRPSPAGVEIAVRVSPDIAILLDRARLADAFAALAAAVARAQTTGGTVILAIVEANEPAGPAIVVAPSADVDSRAAERAPRLDRSGAGLTLALAELTVRRHGGALAERWIDDSWAGYVVRLAIGL